MTVQRRMNTLNLNMKRILEARGFSEGANSRPGTYVVERAFVD